ncbi:hypothetical protein UlMin_002728 [Ulmus minor]
MAESLIQISGIKASSDGVSDCKPDSVTDSSLFHRRIEFHPARKPFRGFSNGGGDFRIETLNPGSQDLKRQGLGPGKSALGGKKADGSEILENGLDPELCFGITFRRIGAGLENLGNTCFLNSVLQCLTYTEPLAAYLQSGKHQNSCHVAGFCALCAIQKHVSRALQSTGRSLAPKDLVSNLRCISRNFRNARQEDAHEYMVNLLESMHKCCLPSGVPSESPSAYEKSLVHKIFGGSLRSQVKCLQCSYCSNKFDPFLDLSLEIAKADSLKKALVNFTAAEQLDGGERQYQCQRCKQKVRALKQLTVHKPPYVLTIHLKRFRAHDPGQKIDRKVIYDPTLDLKPFVSCSNEGDLKYTLYGVLVHHGWSTHSGHYYCYVRTSSGMWYSLDDSRVVQVSEKTVLEQKAYMLFYVRDRKNIVPRKSVDVSQKENRANDFGIKTSANYNQSLKSPVQNGSAGVRSNAEASSIAATRKDVLDGPAKIPASNERSELSMSKPSLTPPMSKVQSEEKPSFIPPNLGKCLTSAAPPSSCGDASNLETATVALTSAHTKDLNEKGSSDRDIGASTVTSTVFEEIQGTSAAKHLTNKTLEKNNPVPNTEELSRDPVGLPAKKDAFVKASDQPSSDKNQVEVTANGIAVGNSLDRTCDQSLVLDEAEKLSGSIVSNGTLHVEDTDGKSHKKLKKKKLRCQVASMHLSTSILFGAPLGLRRKKKHKRSKRKTLGAKNLRTEVLIDNNCISSDMGPSTSEGTRTISSVSTHSPRNKAKSGSKNEANGTSVKDTINPCGNSLVNVVDGALSQRIGQNGTVLATDKKLQNGYFNSSINHMSAMENGTPKDCKRDKIQNGWQGVLTQGLEDAVVAHWDGIEFPSQNVEYTATESCTIGYVGDEWDQEYDRGKRKKIRQSKHEFGGPNPFQEIAAKKAHLKRAKLEGYNSGNQPIRI